MQVTGKDACAQTHGSSAALRFRPWWSQTCSLRSLLSQGSRDALSLHDPFRHFRHPLNLSELANLKTSPTASKHLFSPSPPRSLPEPNCFRRVTRALVPPGLPLHSVLGEWWGFRVCPHHSPKPLEWLTRDLELLHPIGPSRCSHYSQEALTVVAPP